VIDVAMAMNTIPQHIRACQLREGFQLRLQLCGIEDRRGFRLPSDLETIRA
jgi:hypothetical protein